MDDTEHTAIHEAGHAVIGRVLGMICGEVTVVANEAENEAGYSTVANPWVTASWWDKLEWQTLQAGHSPLRYRDASLAFRGTIMTRMAGAEAERELLGYCQVGDGDDRAEIELLAQARASDLSEELWSRYEPRARRQVRRLIRKHRDKIERVAAALLQHKTLSADAVASLM